MLKTRILTAFVLLFVFFFALFYFPPIGWLVFATLVAAFAGWEWGALMALGMTSRVVFGIVTACICAVIVALFPGAFGLTNAVPEAAWYLGRWFYFPATVFWLLIVPIWMKSHWSLPKSVVGLFIGLVVILPTWLALVQLKQTGGEVALVLILSAVWIADIAAYAFGRTLGKHKLAPGISPGKTWEGAIGGGLAVIAYGFTLSPKLPSVLAENGVLLFSLLLLFTVISIVGDLFESLLKRQAGLKDSSSILPGHGGVLDRIDSLTSTLPLVALVWLGTVYNAWL